jgi:hypothetical protein
VILQGCPLNPTTIHSSCCYLKNPVGFIGSVASEVSPYSWASPYFRASPYSQASSAVYYRTPIPITVTVATPFSSLSRRAPSMTSKFFLTNLHLCHGLAVLWSSKGQLYITRKTKERRQSKHRRCSNIYTLHSIARTFHMLLCNQQVVRNHQNLPDAAL